MQEEGASEGLTGIYESHQLEKKHGGGLLDLQVHAWKTVQKLRRRALQAFLPDHRMAKLRKRWRQARRNHIKLTERDYRFLSSEQPAKNKKTRIVMRCAQL